MELVLVIDDDLGFRALVTTVLRGAGFAVDEATTVAEGRAAIGRRKYDLVVTDLRLPDGEGVSLVELVKEETPDVPVIMITAFATVENAVEAMKHGAADYLRKPLANPDELLLVARRALELRRLQQYRDLLREELDTGGWEAFIGRAPSVQEMLSLARKAAPSDVTVLLLGETGAGKEVLARCIHESSNQADGPFVAVNCAALSPTLIESELFGHEKGAFTGAANRHPGRFERAAGGTIFLDEIGELDVGLQAKLLRVLQERKLERIGGTQEIAVSARVIAASNQKLEQLAAEGRFRQDLFYRLTTFPISIPSLRERRLDIEPLARHFLSRVSRSRKIELSSDALAVCLDYDWPGNVRELQNVMERAAILCEDEVLPEHLPIKAEPTRPQRATLAEIERAEIERTLAENGGNRTATAKKLGISVRTLQYRLKEYGITND